ncbi:hypothetical protein EG68_01828 [Paragonimus skrjabini miyazakii]|uniref:Uncharacterized protein n=1 Tax=Paragonimus skrjabini miyazakii TaxID=59628 RepID=A0A8S9Z0N7_9TREM|nr:hypothetical protein EG68_01828 [Paragonimus skrjabini miyazakii]
MRLSHQIVLSNFAFFPKWLETCVTCEYSNTRIVLVNLRQMLQKLFICGLRSEIRYSGQIRIHVDLAGNHTWTKRVLRIVSLLSPKSH